MPEPHSHAGLDYQPEPEYRKKPRPEPVMSDLFDTAKTPAEYADAIIGSYQTTAAAYGGGRYADMNRVMHVRVGPLRKQIEDAIKHALSTKPVEEECRHTPVQNPNGTTAVFFSGVNTYTQCSICGKKSPA